MDHQTAVNAIQDANATIYVVLIVAFFVALFVVIRVATRR